MGKLIRTIKNVLGGETNKNYEERSGGGRIIRTIKNVVGGETNQDY